MESDDPRLYVSIQQVLGVMAIKQHKATHLMNKQLDDHGPGPTVAYRRGQQDALQEIAAWLRDYTGWEETLETFKQEKQHG